ncbi:DNA-binding response regulator, LytR/AlgR family [Tenacibaculum sp. MAR_2010_89]|uniref:LytR/AlgR family response regulator transcription factor n=1 Tax=Tenacibaculum sp. MAR_2010_89 TaxID=1250198 RepID=UPI0008952A60|nr:LytTR family DNA-binding domain-containing protein [Tenacibaculum sp. MAR_2010_89]SEE17529.1 DNA-binding response regulator, LytR/AlgR family [Tenacibaculum sp. MAR_2010_89]
MENLKCIIADDEPIARQILESYIKELPNLELISSCKNSFEVMAVLQEKEVDLLFLDINMPKLSGLSLLKTLQQKPSVIITTAYPEYAVEGFELSVTDYLLKPFSFERFFQAVMKIKKKGVIKSEVFSKNKEEENSSIFVKSDKKIIKLNFNEINYIEAYGNYIKIYTDKRILTPQTLTDFLKKIPTNFIRIHKSFAINFNKIVMIDGNQIVLQNELKLAIGKSYRKELLQRIDKGLD